MKWWKKEWNTKGAYTGIKYDPDGNPLSFDENSWAITRKDFEVPMKKYLCNLIIGFNEKLI